MLNGTGRGVNARLDVPLVILNDVKWAATVFEELAKQLTELAFNDERPHVYRVLAARWAMDNAKLKLHSTNKRTESLGLQRKNRTRRP
ncbi:MAG: hypothetical protein EBT15_07010 [Betaproteobacteria bacterium]|nr:hypothetical protein [Betaproteobacteria bacterium]